MKTKMILLTLVGISILSSKALANTDTTIVSQNAVNMPADTILTQDDFILQEEIAEFPGGDRALTNYFNQQIHYPELAKHQGIEGKIIASFIINENGTAENIIILHSIGGNCDEEVIRAIENMPSWKPAVQAGHTIRTKKLISVEFRF